MARPLRIEYPNAYYHVTNRGQDRKKIFPGDTYYQVFLEGVAEACRRLNVEVHSYCLLNNEYHLLVKTPEGNLSRFMRQVDGLYTQNFQRLKKTRGSVFRARYKAVLVQAEQYLLRLSSFLHNLPRRQRVDPQAHPWSSYTLYSSKARPQPWLVRDEVLAQLGGTTRRYNRYCAFVAQGQDEELSRFYGKKNLLSVLGDDKFRQKAQGRLERGAARGTCKGTQARKRPSTRKVVKAVARHFQVSENSIYQAARGPGSKNLPRWVAMYLCQELSGVTLQTIAERFGLKRYGTVSTTIGKLKQELQQSPKTVACVNQLEGELKAS